MRNELRRQEKGKSMGMLHRGEWALQGDHVSLEPGHKIQKGDKGLPTEMNGVS